MSKRNTFERNIKSLTRTKSLKVAIRDWEIKRDISIPRNKSGVTCELCGTMFRSGALICRRAIRGRKEARITVGGTCLETILRGSFADKKTIVKRKGEVFTRLKNVYGSLVDPGNWIRWLTEHVPTRLAPLAAQLKHLGMVSTDRELNRLIKFHDANRRYPLDALVPDGDDFHNVLGVPAEITMDEARAILRGLTVSQFTKLLACRSARYADERIDKSLAEDREWHAAWRQLTSAGRRTVLALACLTDYLEYHSAEVVDQITSRLSAIGKSRLVPFFVWHEKGLGLAVELCDDLGDNVKVWIWSTNKFEDVDVSRCRRIDDVDEQLVLKLEELAFWYSPEWSAPQLFTLKKSAKPTAQRTSGKATKRYAVNSSNSNLQDLSCVRRLLELAEFRGKESLEEQVAWLKQKLRRMGIGWDDFLWSAERYATSIDCRNRIDGLTKRFCLGVTT